MRYFQIVQDERITNAVEPQGMNEIPKELLTRDRLHELEDWLLQFEVRDQPGGGTFLDYLQRPVPLWSDQLKHHLETCLKKIKAQPVILTDLKRLKQEPYWIVLPPVIHCASPASVYRKDGTLQRLVIQDERVNYPMFKVGGIREDMTIVNLAIAESMLRRGFTGIKYVRVDSELSLEGRALG